MLAYAIEAFMQSPLIESIWIGVSPGFVDNPILKTLTKGSKPIYFLPTGGSTRQETVRNTLAEQLKSGISSDDWILVHDAARPGITPELIEKLIASVQDSDVGGLLAVRLADTLKRADLDLAIAGNMPRIEKTIPREHLWQAQTPQMFGLQVLHDALQDAIRLEADVTDEASAIELKGVKPLLIEGATRNFKVTHPADWDLMQLLLNSENKWRIDMTQSNAHVPQFRIGQGYDIHALVADRKLILGGVHVPHEKGLLGHSDADVLLHALTDALLGAAGLNDIGQLFPDTDPQFKNMDSRILLRAALQKVQAAGFQIGNVDATIICQKPKLADFLPEMVRNIATDLSVTPSHVNLKAKTNESLGHLGRGEGVAVHAVALLYKA